MSDFTQGKWIYSDPFIFAPEGLRMSMGKVEKGVIIGQVYLLDNEEEQYANARLFTAAPEMYELLEECADVLQALLHRDDCNKATDLYQVEELIHDLWDLLARIDGAENTKGDKE